MFELYRLTEKIKVADKIFTVKECSALAFFKFVSALKENDLERVLLILQRYIKEPVPFEILEAVIKEFSKFQAPNIFEGNSGGIKDKIAESYIYNEAAKAAGAFGCSPFSLVKSHSIRQIHLLFYFVCNEELEKLHVKVKLAGGKPPKNSRLKIKGEEITEDHRWQRAKELIKRRKNQKK